MTQVRKQWLLVILAAILLGVVIAYLNIQISGKAQRPKPAGKEGQTLAANIEVVSTQVDSYQASITAYGSASSRFQLSLQAQVGGEITTLSPQLESGALVTSGATLITLDARDYQAALASAESEVQSARVALLEEEREGELAQAEWQAANLAPAPDSDLVFRQPQLKAAQATLRQATSNRSSAQRDLENTQIKAPFNALVVERLVSPGSLVQAGTELATLYSSDEVEIHLNLAATDWANLPPFINADADLSATLSAVNGSGQWRAKVARQTQHLDAETRQRALVLTVDQPLQQTPPLFPGQFVKAQISGTEQNGLWRLPLTSLSQRSEIWYVTETNRLAKFSADVSFSSAEFIYITPPTELSTKPQLVVARPLNSYLVGMQVNPITSQGDTRHE